MLSQNAAGMKLFVHPRAGAILIGLLASAAAADDLGQPGPFKAGRRTVQVPRPGGGAFSSYLYYPALTNGDGAAFDGSGAPYPAVSFGHGFLQPVTSYNSTLAHLATWGYFVIATTTQDGFFPSHSQFAADMSLCLTFLEDENARPESWLFAAVDLGAFGLSGHSMGGGASILAAATDGRIKALANMAAAETNPSAINGMKSVTAPVCLISGSDDTIVPVKTNGLKMYQAGSAPRQLPIIQGGFHCGFLDQVIIFCDSGSMSLDEQLLLTRRQLTGFFNLYLRHDPSSWRSVWGPESAGNPEIILTADPGVEIRVIDPVLHGPPGGQARGQAAIRNTGPRAAEFSLATEGGDWSSWTEPETTGTLQTGQEVVVEVIASVPSQGGADQLLLVAMNLGDGGTRAWSALSVQSSCRADLDSDTALTLFDFLAFTNLFNADDAAADWDGNGVLDLFDFLGFVNSFNEGC